LKKSSLITRTACALALALISLLSCTANAQEPSQTLIRNVSVWDGMAENAVANQDVFIVGHMIKTIGSNLEVLDGTNVIDGGGRVLMPGLIDAHIHLGNPDIAAKNADPGYSAALSLVVAERILMQGWTTVRDLGGAVVGIARAIDEGHMKGPRIFPSSVLISQTSGHTDFRNPMDIHPNIGGANQNELSARFSMLADGEAEVRRAVRESLRRGATQIKLMAGGGIGSPYDPIDTVQFSEAELRAAVEVAADWNTYVGVHAYTDRSVNRAISAGVKVIEHGHLLSKETLQRMKDEGVSLSGQSFATLNDIPYPEGSYQAEKAAIVMAGTDTMMEVARDIGLPVHLGADASGSMEWYDSTIYEFKFRQKWFSSVEILRQATGHNSKLLEMTGPRNPYPDGPIGVIKEGAYADLLIIEGNPLEDSSILVDHKNTMKLIMKNGVIYKNILQD